MKKRTEVDLTDETLMMAVKIGRIEYLELIFEKYNRKLVNFFYGNCKDHALSKDLAQNVFERIIIYRSRYNEKFPFESWLFRIAWNELNDYYRGKRLSLPGNEKVLEMLPHLEVGKEDTTEEQKIRLKKSLDQLSDNQKQLIILTQYNGHNYAEVAMIMNCSESAIKVRMHRTMKALKAEYRKCMVA